MLYELYASYTLCCGQVKENSMNRDSMDFTLYIYLSLAMLSWLLTLNLNFIANADVHDQTMTQEIMF